MSTRRTAVTLLVATLGACSRVHSSSGVDTRSGRSQAGRPAGASDNPLEANDGGAFSSGVFGDDNHDLEVWSGQLWSDSDSLCDADHTDQTDIARNAYPPATSNSAERDPKGHVDHTVLVLERSRDGVVSGKIQLGEGLPFTTPEFANRAGCTYWFSRGFEYTLRHPELRSDRLRFGLSYFELWTVWCGEQTAMSYCPDPNEYCIDICDCKEGGACKPYEADVAFDLAITADTIEGPSPVSEGPWGTPGELRLTRLE